ncbi:UDP-glucosyltransferase 2-like [Helicoverpa zea]|uniref:UDP-glucosyltransferase 2-like n=1 Tax=Helicoverpa zea TaxID=7113 RepID=UPI001F58A302|nr:UDP-glucosyltransferase 2-like [Helicoverpa zea]
MGSRLILFLIVFPNGRTMMSLALCILVLSITYNDAARILAVFPVPSISHQVVFRPLTQVLARRGHEVTVITPDPVFTNGEAPANLTEIDVHFTYEVWKKFYETTSGDNNDLIEQTHTAFSLMNRIFEVQMKVDKVQKILKEQKFDLLLLEACVKPALVLSHILKVPVIQVSSFGPIFFNTATVGSAWHPLLYPINYVLKLNNLTKWEKLKELWSLYKIISVMQQVEQEENKTVKKLFGPDVPAMSELKNNVDMLFANIHPLWDSNRPVPPSVIHMGGLHQKPQKELPQDLKSYLDSSKNGVVYISFGTNVKPSRLPREKIQILIKVFSELPYDVLWKWDEDDLPGCSSNVRIEKWLPQSDLLRHPKIKVFITQGGQQSTDEAITAGVPLIGVPMLGDQWFNVEKYITHEIGVRLDIETLTEEQFKNAITEVIGDKKYRQNIKKFGEIIRDEPMTPLERAVWWTEHVLRHGGARNLRSPAANMSWSQFLELELVVTVLSVVLGLIFLSSLLLYYSYKHFVLSPKQKKLTGN